MTYYHAVVLGLLRHICFPIFLAFVFCVNMEKIPYYLGYEANELGKKRLNCLGTKRPS